MTLLLIVLLAAVFLFQARGSFAGVLAHRRLRSGDYTGALRVLRWIGMGMPTVMMLHWEGLILSLAGRPEEAVGRLRVALAMAHKGARYPSERLFASLAYALMDLGRYAESELCFHRAIEGGDTTGNTQDGLAELRLRQGIEPENALSYCHQAIEHAKRRADKRVPGVYYAHRAWALALLGRNGDADESLAEALQVPVKDWLEAASLHWRVGMVLLKLGKPAEAREHFRAGHEADPKGKYGGHCGELLASAA